MSSLSLFHYSEYLVTAVNNPKSLSLDSFLLNHSLEYTVAALSSWIEFTLENIFWPGQCALLCFQRGDGGFHVALRTVTWGHLLISNPRRVLFPRPLSSLSSLQRPSSAWESAPHGFGVEDVLTFPLGLA